MSSRVLALPGLAAPLLLAAAPLFVASAPQGGRGGGEPAPGGDRADEYFDTADWDGDGFITFGEAAPSLEIDRSVFAAYDSDRDGLISRAEFGTRYAAIVARGGVFPAPRKKPEAARATWRDATELLRDLDADLDHGLSELEVARALEQARLEDPTAATVMTSLDGDRNGVLEGAELDALIEVLRPSPAGARARTATSFAELFDHTEPRPDRAGLTIAPPRILGPVSMFRRLDFDQDGGITLRDLEELQRPLTTAVRAPAVLATLDTNGDGRIDREEFAAALR